MVSRSRRSGLILPVTRVTLRARRLAPGKRFTSTSGVAITAALQCFAEDLLNAAADAAAHEGVYCCLEPSKTPHKPSFLTPCNVVEPSPEPPSSPTYPSPTQISHPLPRVPRSCPVLVGIATI